MPLRVIARGEQGRTAAGKAGKAITVREDVAEACRQRWRHLVAPVDFVVVDSQMVRAAIVEMRVGSDQVHGYRAERIAAAKRVGARRLIAEPIQHTKL